MGSEVQEMLERELNRCKDNEQELYSLDRKRAEQMAEIQKDITEVKTKMDDLETDVAEIKIEVKEIKRITTENSQRKKWEPKDYCVVIVALLSLIGTIITAWVK